MLTRHKALIARFLGWSMIILLLIFLSVVAQGADRSKAQHKLYGEQIERSGRFNPVHDTENYESMSSGSSAKTRSAVKKTGYWIQSNHGDGSRGTWIQPGHTGTWYNTEQDGHGIFVEVLEDQSQPTGARVLLAWYVYFNGQQVWIIATGPVMQDGNRHKAILDAYIYSGGDFPPNFNPDEVTGELWGEITLEFFGCSAVEMVWTTSYPGFTSGLLDMQRLTRILDSSCDPSLGGDDSAGHQDDHGDDWQTGTAISNGESIQGQIEHSDDIDVFNFSVGEEGALARIYTTGGLDTYGNLYRISSASVGRREADDNSGEGSNFLMDVELNEADYSIYVNSRTATGAYTVFLELRDIPDMIPVNFQNFLRRDVRAFINGQSVGVIPAGTIRGQPFGLKVGDRFSWSVIQNFGDNMGGSYPEIDEADLESSQLDYVVDNVVGNSRFFIPSISNALSSNKLLGVNMGLPIENRCDCLIPANTNDVLVGYFRLVSQSNCSFYDEGSGYTGDPILWDGFSDQVEENSGFVSFTIDQVEFN